jgi:hypothetical protein
MVGHDRIDAARLALDDTQVPRWHPVGGVQAVQGDCPGA